MVQHSCLVHRIPEQFGRWAMPSGMTLAAALGAFVISGLIIASLRPAPPVSSVRHSYALAIAMGQGTAPLACRRMVQLGPVGVGRRCIRTAPGAPSLAAAAD
jgi:hypothetical protein